MVKKRTEILGAAQHLFARACRRQARDIHEVSLHHAVVVQMPAVNRPSGRGLGGRRVARLSGDAIGGRDGRSWGRLTAHGLRGLNLLGLLFDGALLAVALDDLLAVHGGKRVRVCVIRGATRRAEAIEVFTDVMPTPHTDLREVKIEEKRGDEKMIDK